jgi:hypothetical protein
MRTKNQTPIESMGNSPITVSFVIEFIRKVSKTQHHNNPEFGHTQGEIFKTPAKKLHH